MFAGSITAVSASNKTEEGQSRTKKGKIWYSALVHWERKLLNFGPKNGPKVTVVLVKNSLDQIKGRQK